MGWANKKRLDRKLKKRKKKRQQKYAKNRFLGGFLVELRYEKKN